MDPENNQEVEEIFRGHLEECLAHLNNIFKQSWKKAAEHRELIAEFCDTKIAAVNVWLQGEKYLPRGETLVRLICCLDLMGFKVIELQKMPEIQRNFYKLLGFRIISNDQACELLGYSDRSAVFAIFHRNRGMSNNKKTRMFDIWKDKKAELAQAIEAARNKLSPIMLSKTKTKEAVQKTFSPAPETFSSHEKACLNIMQGLLSLLNKDENGNKCFSGTSVDNLQLYSKTILQLTAHLNDLNFRLMTREEKGGGADGRGT